MCISLGPPRRQAQQSRGPRGKQKASATVPLQEANLGGHHKVIIAPKVIIAGDNRQRLLHDHDLRGDPVGFPGQLTIRAGRNYVHNFQQVDYTDGIQSRKPHYSEVTSLVRGKYVACEGLATPSRVHNRNHFGCSAILAQGRGTPEQVTV